jgi:amino acid permease
MTPEPKANPSFGPAGYAIAIVLMHLALSIAHGLAHSHLAIALTMAQKIFVGVVIVATPLVAAYLIRRRKLRLGGALLAISMAGALAFGVYYHFIAPGPDNVNQTDQAGPANWRNLFEDTAIDLALIEAVGTLAGAVLFFRSLPSNVPGASPGRSEENR